jgi:hypothetical protein
MQFGCGCPAVSGRHSSGCGFKSLEPRDLAQQLDSGQLLTCKAPASLHVALPDLESVHDFTLFVMILLVYAACRYYKLNLRALERHGTVEFRAAGGTQNATKVAGYVLLFLNLADASYRGKKAPPPQQKEYVFENMVKFVAEHTGCVVLLHWLPRRKLELNSRSSRAASGQGSGSSGGGGPVSVVGGSRGMRAHAGGCGCADCRQSSGGQR